MAFASVPDCAPLLLPGELAEVSTRANDPLKLFIEASVALQRYCHRRFDERRDTLTFSAWLMKRDGDLVNASTLQLRDDLRQVLTLAKDVPAGASSISEGTSIAPSSYITPGRRSVSDLISRIQLLSDGFAGGVGSPADLQSIWVDGLWGWGGSWVDTGYTLADNPLTIGAAAVTPSDTEGFEPGHVLKLGSEYMYVKTVGDTTLTTKRAFNGSAAASHASGTAIYFWEADAQVKGLVRRLLTWAGEQIKSPVAGAVTLGEFSYPVDMSGLPKDVFIAIDKSGLRRIGRIDGF